MGTLSKVFYHSNLTPVQSVYNSRHIRADLSKGFIVAGQSVGANFTAVLTHRAKEDHIFTQHPITGQALQMPVTVHPDAVPEEYASCVR